MHSCDYKDMLTMIILQMYIIQNVTLKKQSVSYWIHTYKNKWRRKIKEIIKVEENIALCYHQQPSQRFVFE